MNTIRTVAFMAPLASAAVLPSYLAPRDAVSNDIIRYQKCANLFVVKDTGGWEQGQAAYFPDKGVVGVGPSERATFEMYTDMEDYFYNKKGTTYGADTESGSIWVDFKESVPAIAPPNGAFIGHATRKTGDQVFGYNCFTDHDNGYEYTDEKLGKCQTYISCIQRDAIRLAIHGSEETEKAVDLPLPSDIFKHLDEAYDTNSRICNEDPIEFHPGCKVTFSCTDDGEQGTILPAMVESLKKASNALSRSWEEQRTGTCDESGCEDGLPKTYTFRSVPSKIQMIARTIPQTDGRVGAQAARLTVTTECEEKDDFSLCDILGVAFGIAEMVPEFESPAAAGGFIAETACGIVESIEEDEG